MSIHLSYLLSNTVSSSKCIDNLKDAWRSSSESNEAPSQMSIAYALPEVPLSQNSTTYVLPEIQPSQKTTAYLLPVGPPSQKSTASALTEVPLSQKSTTYVLPEIQPSQKTTTYLLPVGSPSLKSTASALTEVPLSQKSTTTYVLPSQKSTAYVLPSQKSTAYVLPEVPISQNSTTYVLPEIQPSQKTTAYLLPEVTPSQQSTAHVLPEVQPSQKSTTAYVLPEVPPSQKITAYAFTEVPLSQKSTTYVLPEIPPSQKNTANIFSDIEPNEKRKSSPVDTHKGIAINVPTSLSQHHVNNISKFTERNEITLASPLNRTAAAVNTSTEKLKSPSGVRFQIEKESNGVIVQVLLGDNSRSILKKNYNTAPSLLRKPHVSNTHKFINANKDVSCLLTENSAKSFLPNQQVPMASTSFLGLAHEDTTVSPTVTEDNKVSNILVSDIETLQVAKCENSEKLKHEIPFKSVPSDNADALSAVITDHVLNFLSNDIDRLISSVKQDRSENCPPLHQVQQTPNRNTDSFRSMQPKACSDAGNSANKTVADKTVTIQEVGTSRVIHCPVCRKEFTWVRILCGHMMREHGRKRYQCGDCPSSFHKKSKLRYHQRKHTGEFPYQCEVCNKKFHEQGVLNTHVKIVHEKLNVLTKCTYCGLVLLEGSLRTHLMKHEGHTPYKCDMCGASFTCKRMVKRHIETHDTSVVPCHICGKACKKSTLRKHARTHKERRLFQCEICGSKLANSGTLKFHMTVHTGEQPHVCEVCGKKFARIYNLATHLKLHAGIKHIVCEICGKTFSQKWNLRKHVESCHK